MNTIEYGKWKIAVDAEKTKEYYEGYIVTENQANRNFSKYCRSMSSEEKAFFESFGISPECCEIEHIGVNKKNEFPCGGYYLICGEYLERPEEELLSVEELEENDFEDDREDHRINIGMFQFDFQCEDYEFKNIPEDMPDGFICVRFWCEEMQWLLEEKPESDMIMYEPPRFWELTRIIKEKMAFKKQRLLDLEERRSEFRALFESFGIEYSELNAKEIKKYKCNWISSLSPDFADKKEIQRLCLSNRKYTPFLWHIFSFEFLRSEADPRECYSNADKNECIVISNVDPIGFYITDAGKISAEMWDDFIDITISSADLSWTYCKTHESVCGPYFYKNY